MPKVFKIFGLTGRELVFAEMFEVDEWHPDASHTGLNAVLEAFRKDNAINVVGDFHAHGRKADAHDALLLLKKRCVRRWIIEAEVVEHSLERQGVACGIFDKKINVARVSGIAMICDRVTTYDDIANPVAVKQPYKIAEVCG